MAARRQSYTREELSEAATGLRRLLDAVRRGEVSADPGEINRLEGAVAALDAVARCRVRPERR